jgi:hypothetical protein
MHSDEEIAIREGRSLETSRILPAIYLFLKTRNAPAASAPGLNVL